MAESESIIERPASEEWRLITLTADHYSVSNWGRVRREISRTCGRAGQILKQRPDKDRYMTVCLSWLGKRKLAKVHQLVAIAFNGPCPEGQEVNHKNGVKNNNWPGNLEYLTSLENNTHAALTGLKASGDRSGSRLHPELLLRGSNHPRSIFSDEDVAEIRRLLALGVRQIDIAARFNCSRSAVCHIKLGNCRAIRTRD